MPASRANPLSRKSRLLLSGLLIVQSVALSAQTAPATTPPAPSDDEVIELSPFTVVGGEEGWTAANTMSGTRTNVPIKDLPRSVQVLTNEFMDDIGATTMVDAAEYMTGVTAQGGQDAVFDNNTLTIRGIRQNRHYRDGVREAFVGMISDNASIDRIEVLRGPSSLLAGVSEPGGVVNQISKRPKTRDETSVKLSAGSWGYYRAELDVSKNLTKKLALRVDVANQSTDSYRPFEGSDRLVGYLAMSYKLAPHTILNLRGETIDYDATVAGAGNGIRIPTTTSATSATAAPTIGQYGFGYVPEEILPWNYNSFGPNSNRNLETYRLGGDLQHEFNDTFSMRAFINWGKSVREDLRLAGSNAITRFLNPALGSVAGNVVPDEVRWTATKDDETWDIWTYQADFRGVFNYWGLKHEAILGVERIETRNWRFRSDTPASTTGNSAAQNSLGNPVSADPNALTRFKFPTAAVGAIPDGAAQPAWTEMLNISRYTVPRTFIDQSIVRSAISLTNMITSKNEQWHALLGVRRDHGETSSRTGTTAANATPDLLPLENATSETLGLLFRPWDSFSVYSSYSSSFSGTPTGVDAYDKLLTKPESGTSFEVGIKSSFLNDKLSITAAAFGLDRKNVKRNLSSAELTAILGYVPTGTHSVQDNGEQSRGVEGQILYRPFTGYQVAVTYAYIKTELVTPDNPVTDGNPISGRPRSNGSVFQKYAFPAGPLKGLSVTNGVTWIDGFRPDTVSNGVVTNYVPGYVLLNFGLGYKTKIFGHAVGMNASVNNATDEHYWTGQQSKGGLRSFRFSMSTKF